MRATITNEAINQDRRRLLGTAAMGMALAGAVSLLPEHLAAATEGSAIRPFHVNFAEADLVDLRRRVKAARCTGHRRFTESPIPRSASPRGCWITTSAVTA
jgi:hypothetical protein